MEILQNATSVDRIFYSANGEVKHAIKNLSLNICEGEFVSVIGMSGSGKTTLLRLLANLETPTSGKISSTKQPIKTSFVFQENALFPWKTVLKNIAYPLKTQHLSKTEKLDKVNAILSLVNLDSSLLNRLPKEISGGEKRRVAIAMALAADPDLLLMDEPTSQLDDVNKWKFQEMIHNIWIEKKITPVLVTHDIDEAIFLSQKIIVLEAGQIKAEVKIDLPLKRAIELRTSNEFNTIKRNVSNIIWERN